MPADNDIDLDSLLPLLMSRQKQQQAEAGSRAIGSMIAPNLTNVLTKPAPTPAPPIPNAAGKIPSQDPMDPRYVGALRDVGMLGAGGLAGRIAAPLAEGAATLAGRTGSALSDSTGAGRVIGGYMGMTPPNRAEAAPKLNYEQRQQLELQRQQQEQSSQAEANRIKAQGEAEANKARLQAQTQRDIEEQNRVAAALREKQDRERPFREKYSTAAEWMPAAGLAASALIPYGKGLIDNRKLGRFVGNWQAAGEDAAAKLAGKTKVPATAAVGKLEDFENKWPGMEKRYTPGFGQALLSGMIPAEMSAFPTEYDFMTQPKGSPGRPTTSDIGETALRSLGGLVAGTGAAKLGANMRSPVLPYTGGPGIIKAYNTKYPPKKPKGQ